MVAIAHHPNEDLLQAYAAGAAGEAQSLLLASHVALCADCRAEASVMEALGGAFLADELPMAMAPATLGQTMARLGSRPGPATAPVDSSGGAGSVPFPLRRYIGKDLDRVRWRHVTHSLSYCRLIDCGATKAYLTKSAPGAGIGPHTHRGNELTLVLAGGFHDEAGHYDRGDLILTTPAIRHSPRADQDGFCISLAMTDAPLSFPSLGAGLVARIFGF